MVGDLHPGRAGKLVGLARNEGREREIRVEARLVVQSPHRHRRRGHRGRRFGGGYGRGAGGAGLRRVGLRRRQSLRRPGAIRDGEGHRNGRARRAGGKFADPAGKAFLHPLQDEAVGRHDPESGIGVLDRQAGESTY